MEQVLLLFIILVSIAIHEAGHMFAALWTGMKVEKFYVGFGPRVFSRNVRGIETGVRALPIGGYVKIPGMDLRKADEYPEGTYATSSWWKQVLVAFGGPVTHWGTAFVLFALAVVATPAYTSAEVPTVAAVMADSQSYDAGFRTGDQMVAFNGESFDRWEDLIVAVVEAEGVGTVEVRRVDGTLDRVTTDSFEPFYGLIAAPDTVADRSVPGVLSQAAKLTVTTTVSVVDQTGELADKVPGLVNAALGRQAPTEDRPRSLVGVFHETDATADTFGLAGVLSLAAQLNLVFGILNLLPVLPLDGGHIVAAIANAVTKRLGRANRYVLNTLVWSTPVVIALFAVLFVTSLTVDIRAIVAA